MRKVMLALLIGMFAVSLASFASAAPVGGSVSTGTSERMADSSAGQVSLTGGNVTEVNVTGYSSTSRWGGFYGEISGGIRLADSSSNVFYEWTVSNVTDAVVYAANDTVSSWASVAAATVSDMPSYLQAAASDNFTNTFTASEAFTSPSLSVASVPYTSTWQNGAQGSLKTYALKEGSTLIWAGKAIADTNSFKGGSDTVDYQILAPANSGETTYYFYVELP